MICLCCARSARCNEPTKEKAYAKAVLLLEQAKRERLAKAAHPPKITETRSFEPGTSKGLKWEDLPTVKPAKEEGEKPAPVNPWQWDPRRGVWFRTATPAEASWYVQPPQHFAPVSYGPPTSFMSIPARFGFAGGACGPSG